jgi:hypothetical protein
MKRNKLLARYIACHGVRNSLLEDFHAGKVPRSETGDYTDVFVSTPYGDIPWQKLSRISNKEMRALMLDVEKLIYKVLETVPKLEKMAGSPEKFEKLLAEFYKTGASWDNPNHETTPS